MHVGTNFLKLPPVTGQYWSLFQCSMLGTGGTCDATCHLHCKQMRAKKGNEFPSVRWTRFLMQWLRRPLGCTEWRDTTINYLLVRHISSSTIRQQRRDFQFYPTGWWC